MYTVTGFQNTQSNTDRTEKRDRSKIRVGGCNIPTQYLIEQVDRKIRT